MVPPEPSHTATDAKKATPDKTHNVVGKYDNTSRAPLELYAYKYSYDSCLVTLIVAAAAPGSNQHGAFISSRRNEPEALRVKPGEPARKELP